MVGRINMEPTTQSLEGDLTLAGLVGLERQVKLATILKLPKETAVTRVTVVEEPLGVDAPSPPSEMCTQDRAQARFLETRNSLLDRWLRQAHMPWMERAGLTGP